MEEAIQLNGHDLLVQSYAEGNSLDQISILLGASVHDVQQLLYDYKKVSMPGRGKKTSENFKQVVYERWKVIKNIRQVSRELGSNEVSIMRIVKNQGEDKGENKDNIPEGYIELDWDNLHTCPICWKSDKVNDLTSDYGDMSKSQNIKKNKSSYCVRCEIEWVYRKGKYYELDWDVFK